jgi:hypothetical protein
MNGLPFIDVVTIEFKIGRERPLHPPKLLEGLFPRPITCHPEVAFSRNRDFDFISLSEIESFDNRSGKTHSQAITPFRDLHKRYPELLYIQRELQTNGAQG